MASRPPLISSNLFCKASFLWLFLLGGCQADPPPLEEGNVPSTYVLAIVDTAQGEPAWLAQYRANLSAHVTLAVSGYTFSTSSSVADEDSSTHRDLWLAPPNTGTQYGHYMQEQCFALLSRVPWLLQPGVDTLYLGLGEPCAKTICDSLASWSPSTYCVPRVGIK